MDTRSSRRIRSTSCLSVCQDHLNILGIFHLLSHILCHGSEDHAAALVCQPLCQKKSSSESRFSAFVDFQFPAGLLDHFPTGGLRSGLLRLDQSRRQFIQIIIHGIPVLTHQHQFLSVLCHCVDRHALGAHTVGLVFDIVFIISGRKIIMKRRSVPSQGINVIQVQKRIIRLFLDSPIVFSGISFCVHVFHALFILHVFLFPSCSVIHVPIAHHLPQAQAAVTELL